MSLVTSCPNCETSFIVKPEQLAAHTGKVRCGHCQHVFNAVDHLNDIPEDETADTDESVVEQTEASDKPASEIEVNKPSFSASPDDVVPTSNSEQVHTTNLLLDIDPVTIANPTYDLDESIFKPKVKPLHWLHVTLLIFFALLALAQSIYFMRQNIVIAWPQTKPYLNHLCETLKCNIELSKNPDLLTIDDSDLKEDAEILGLIHLSSSLINNAPYAQAYPNLELTLTDANDIPLLRRTFKPKEYLPAGTMLNEGIASGAEAHINLSLTASGESVTGYRVFLTYDESNENH